MVRLNRRTLTSAVPLLATAALLPSPPVTATVAFNKNAYTLRTLDRAELDYMRHLDNPFLANQDLLDADDVRIYLRDGQEYNHPVAQAQYGMNLLASYRHAANQEALDHSIRQGQRLIDAADVANAALYFPYHFSWPAVPSDGTYAPPCYSGMAQGQALQLFVRLAAAADHAKWMQAAEQTFNSFLPLNDFSLPWTPDTDTYGSLWFEEYPASEKGGATVCRAFNGHVFAILGVYEYWLASGDARAVPLIQGGMTTIHERFAEFRQEGGISLYCLGHRDAYKSYHYHHTKQLYTLYSISGDPFFATAGDLYMDDYALNYLSETVTIPVGTYRALKVNLQGEVVDEQEIAIHQETVVKVSQRSSITGVDGVWYTIASGPHEGWHLRERDNGLRLDGLVSVLTRRFTPPRSAWVGAGEIDVWDSAGANILYPQRSITLSETVTAEVSARSVINGVDHLLLALPGYGNFWVPRDADVRYIG